MSMLEKFKKGAQKAGMQATAFAQTSSVKIASGSRDFAQGFSLPGEADKAAKILDSFLGAVVPSINSKSTYSYTLQQTQNDRNQHSMRSQKLSCNELEVFHIHTKRYIILKYLGLAIFQVLKAGFVFSGKAGSGIVIARLPDGSWSAPSCIATGGLGWGLQIGADITDFVVVLNSEDAVRAFSLGGNVTIGGNISASAGPIGTGGSVQASLAHPAPMFSYSKSKGVCISLTPFYNY